MKLLASLLRLEIFDEATDNAIPIEIVNARNVKPRNFKILFIFIFILIC
jgi:hypothetical protein